MYLIFHLYFRKMTYLMAELVISHYKMSGYYLEMYQDLFYPYCQYLMQSIMNLSYSIAFEWFWYSLKDLIFRQCLS